MRTYIVIPDGTAVLRVEASTPQYAMNKARRGKGEHIAATAAALPESALIAGDDRPTVIPGQLALPVERPECDGRLAPDIGRLSLLREARASVALDGETIAIEA